MRPRERERKLVAAFIIGTLAACATAVTMSPSDLLRHPSTYDGQTVTVAGTVKFFEGLSSDRANPGGTFELCDSATCVHVNQSGTLDVANGENRTVYGTFSIRKAVTDKGQVPFYEIDVRSE